LLGVVHVRVSPVYGGGDTYRSDYNSAGLVIAEIGEVKREKAAADAAAAAGGDGEKMSEAEPEDEKACKICFVNAIDSVLLNCGTS
jgi:hypothetical protein